MDDKIIELIENIDSRLGTMENKLDIIDSRLNKIDERLTSIENRSDKIEIQQKEHIEILKALEHSSEVHKSSIDNMNHNVAELVGEVKSIRKDLLNVELITSNNWSDIVKLKAVR